MPIREGKERDKMNSYQPLPVWLETAIAQHSEHLEVRLAFSYELKVSLADYVMLKHFAKN